MSFWKRKSLRARLIGYFSLLSVVTVGIVASTAYWQARQAIVKDIHDRLTAVTALKSAQLDEWVENQLRDILLASRQPPLQENMAILLAVDPENSPYRQAYQTLDRYLSDWIEVKPNMRGIRLTTNGGFVIFASDTPKIEGKFRPLGNPATYFTPEGKETVIPNFYLSKTTGQAAITLATSIFDEVGVKMAALTVDLQLGEVDALIRNDTGLGETGETYLVGKNGIKPILISGEEADALAEGGTSLGIERAIARQDGFGLYRNYKGIPVVGVYRWLPEQNLALLAEISQQEAFVPARQLARNILAIGTIASGVLLVAVALLSRRIVAPIEAIGATAEKLAAGDLNQKAPVITEDEVGLLARTFNQMAAQLKAAFEDLEHRVRERTAELAEAKVKADEANHAKSVFLANMSHELRSPLNAILGFAKIMTRSQTLPEEHQENIRIISRSGEHLLSLINNVLDLSKIEAKRTTLNEKNFDLHRLIDDIEDMLHLKAEAKGLQLLVERINDVPQYICTDEVKLRQVLINLINNAIKFTSQGGVLVRVFASHQSFQSPVKQPTTNNQQLITNNQQLITNNQQPTTKIIFEVEDTGAGIAEEEIDKLFEAFTQTETGRQAQEGTGLGLPISRKFVQLMGGDIQVTSQVNKGTIFTFAIEAAIVEENELESKAPKRHVIALEPNQPRYRILIVDDKPLNRKLLIKLLSPLGFELKEAGNGREAVEIAKNWQPHLIWMDMRMPVMDGYEATQKIKATTQGQAMTIIALTASVLEEEKAVVLSAGCDDFMRKPFREEDIFNIMAEYLGVRYIYEESESQTGETAESQESIQEKTIALSPELKEQLKYALMTGKLTRISQAMDSIRQWDGSLAEALQKYCDRFEYQKLLNWLSDT